MNKIVEVREVSKQYGEEPNIVHALTNVHLQVAAGELVAIMGASGSGKSTLLKIVGGLDAPTSGNVFIEGQEMTALTNKQRAALRRKHVGYVFQDLNLLAPLTAVENVSLPLELDGIKTKQAKKKAIKLLEQLGLEDKLDSYPDTLSGGQQQRVAIARAFVGDRKLILADEPTGALDSVTGESIMRLIKEFCSQGSAGVMVTHDAKLAAWADRVVFVKDGIISDETSLSGVETLLVESGQQ